MQVCTHSLFMCVLIIASYILHIYIFTYLHLWIIVKNCEIKVKMLKNCDFLLWWKRCKTLKTNETWSNLYDHVISGPMRGLKIYLMERGHNSHTQKLDWPGLEGRVSPKLQWFCLPGEIDCFGQDIIFCLEGSAYCA